MEEDEFFDPTHIGFLGANAIVFHPDDLPDLIQQLQFVCSRTFGL